jgi:hypothetical protein
MTVYRFSSKSKVKKTKFKKSEAQGFAQVQLTEPWRQELKDLADIFSGLEIEQYRLRAREDHAKLFEKLDKLEADKEAVKIKIQAIARAKAKQGQSVSLINLPYITVHVNGTESARQFDLAKAFKYWSQDILEQVLTVDAKKVEALLLQGLDKFPEELAVKAVLPREAKTPAVYIKVNAEEFTGKKRRTG